MFGQFLRGSGDFYATIFVTTMWDRPRTQQARQRAESNFVQLRDEILEEFITNNAQITSFMNTRSSALDILDKTTLYSEAFCELPTSAMELLERELYDCIESALLKRGSLETELANLNTKHDLELKAILERAQEENHDALIKFIGQYSALRRLNYRVSDDGYERWLYVHNIIQRLPLVIQNAIHDVPSLYPNEAWWETISPVPAQAPKKQLKKPRPLSWTSRIDQRMQSFQLPHRAQSASVRSPSEQISGLHPISIKVQTSVTYTD